MKKEIKIGIFTILMILVAWGGVRFLSGIDLLSKNNDYYASYEQVTGIQQASPIFIRGVKIGSVSEISLNATSNSKVTLQLTISNKYQIPADSEAKIFSCGIMGPTAVEIVLGSSSKMLESGDFITPSRDLDIFATAGSELEYVKTKIDSLTTNLSKTLSNLNSLIENNSSNIESMLSNMSDLSGNLNQLLEKNEKSITTMVDGFSKVSKTLGDNAPNIDSIIMNINTLSQDLSQANLGESLTKTLSQVDTLMAQLNDEKGTAALLMNDEKLYNNLAAASANLDSLFIDFKQNPSRYVNISVFGKSEAKQKAKAEKKALKEAEKEAKKAEKK